MVIPQFAQAGLGHVVDARQHISEPRLGIDVVELCRGDQAAYDRRPLAAEGIDASHGFQRQR